MRTLTLMLANPVPSPTRLDIFGWRVDASSSVTTVPSRPAHELAHTVQQGGGVRAWLVPKSAPTTARGAATTRGFDLSHRLVRRAGFTPEVGDEVLVAFQFGEARRAAMHFNPKEFTVTKHAQFQLDLGPVMRGAVKLVVRQRGTEPLFMVATCGEGAQQHAPSWTRVL